MTDKVEKTTASPAPAAGSGSAAAPNPAPSPATAPQSAAAAPKAASSRGGVLRVAVHSITRGRPGKDQETIAPGTVFKTTEKEARDLDGLGASRKARAAEAALFEQGASDDSVID